MQAANVTGSATNSTQANIAAKNILGSALAKAGILSQNFVARPVAKPAATVSQHATETVYGPLTAVQEQLLLEHLPVVRHVARAIHERLPQHVELEELVGAGTLGLVDAVRKFNPAKGAQFRSYAQFRMRGAILDSLRSLDWSPRELRRKGRAIAEAKCTLEQTLGRVPQEAEVAAAMGCSLLELQHLSGQLKSLELVALQTERGEDSGEEELASLPAKDSENPLTQCLEAEKKQRLIAGLDSLPERERLVMTLYYYEELTMKEIGTVLGVVESRVSQMHTMALRRLRSGLGDLHASGANVRTMPVRHAS